MDRADFDLRVNDAIRERSMQFVVDPPPEGRGGYVAWQRDRPEIRAAGTTYHEALRRVQVLALHAAADRLEKHTVPLAHAQVFLFIVC